jgi:hypothetical protein
MPRPTSVRKARRFGCIGIVLCEVGGVDRRFLARPAAEKGKEV